ncbi:MAG: PD-(D/E)XK nuclease family protein [Nitrospirae bacterium]|nr:PD-(D/E)XK nuclease family protein [Candidatus Manganitrophaceae bacterium]
MIYSPSRLETYRQCPQKFKFTYIDQVPSSLEGVEAFMGSRVHEALYQLYLNLRFCKKMSLEELLSYYEEIWEKEWHGDIQIVRDEMTPDEYRALGEKCLVDYYRRYAPFDQTRTLGLEHPVQFALDPDGKYSMKGFIDRLSQPKDGVIWIHDYKTKGFFPTQQDLDQDRQLAYYQMAIQQLWPETKEVELIWHYLIFDQEFHSRRTRADLDALREETITLIQEIETTTDFPVKQSALCSWCEYRALCPLFRHQYETAALSKNEYMSEEGVFLVERLAALQSEEARIKGEVEKVKEALLAYARKKGVEVLFSKTHKVRIKVYDNIRFQGKSDPGRAALERAIKEAGKWEEVSSLDVYALSKLLLNGTWGADLAERIKKFGKSEKSPWIKVFPRDDQR